MLVRVKALLWMTWAETACERANINPAAMALCTRAFLVMPPFSLARKLEMVLRGGSR